MSDQHLKTNPDQETVVQSRRRLLKAAAATAPLIATLPNGAAWATASTAQCIINSQTAGAANVVTDPPPAGDTLVRQLGREVIVGPKTTNDSSRLTVYTIDPDDGTYYKSDGTLFIDNSWEEKSSTDVQLLRVFTATPISDPTSVKNCLGGTSPTTGSNTVTYAVPNPGCIYPASLRSPSDNQPLAMSCLCSVNPTLGGVACGVLPPT